MIIVLKADASQEEIQHVEDAIRDWGLTFTVSRGEQRTVIGVIGDESTLEGKALDIFPGVERVMPVLKPYKLASAENREERTTIELAPVRKGDQPVVIGGHKIVVMAGPCSVENLPLLQEIAEGVKEAGGCILRGGAFKPRTSPYAFQGLGAEGLDMMAQVRETTGLPIITEVMDTKQVELVAEKADILQIGARNMQNFNLLTAAGQTRIPVMIKRGLSATISELLMSAEYILSQGNSQVILCERGIRTFETMTRNTLDLNAVPVLRRETHLPIIVDPSHGTGHWDLVSPMARASIAAGADGVVVEIHPTPETAPCDGSQALLPSTFAKLMVELKAIAGAIGRGL